MTDWRKTIEDKLAEIDLWALNQVNAGLDHISTKTGQFISEVKDKTKSKAEEAFTQIKTAGAKLARSIGTKPSKN